MPCYKLTYLNMRGSAEPIRFLLSYGNVEFEDQRLDPEQWKNLKPLMPLGQVPVLEIDGVKTYQHLAICRYLGKKFNLSGNDEWEDLQIDSIADTLNDIKSRVVSIYMDIMKKYPDTPRKEIVKHQKYLEIIKVIEPHWEKLDKIVQENNGYYANKKLSWVDLYFTASTRFLHSTMQEPAKYVNLQKLEHTVLTIPAIKRWVENRPVTPT